MLYLEKDINESGTGGCMKSIRALQKKKVTLDEISEFYKIEEYTLLYEKVKQDIEEGIIVPIKSSKLNGKKPALYHTYKVIPLEEDYSMYENEMTYELNGLMDLSYYRKNMSQYVKDRVYIKQLSHFLDYSKDTLQEAVSMNERSFEIWGREKYLKQEGGKRLLKNLGIGVERLHIYETAEPLAYYAHHKQVPQRVLILENMDTFYSMRRYLLAGHSHILGIPIGTLIYGGGKGICKSFKDFSWGVEPYLAQKDNTLLYFGDLDYEGIGIFESLKEAFNEANQIIPFKEAYVRMIKKAIKKQISLPETKEGQNKHLTGVFFTFFDEGIKQQMIEILEAERYIPQEILNINDFSEKRIED